MYNVHVRIVYLQVWLKLQLTHTLFVAYTCTYEVPGIVYVHAHKHVIIVTCTRIHVHVQSTHWISNR